MLKVPEVHWDLSSERVLTMEYCEGGKVDDREYMEKHGINVNEVVTVDSHHLKYLIISEYFLISKYSLDSFPIFLYISILVISIYWNLKVNFQGPKIYFEISVV